MVRHFGGAACKAAGKIPATVGLDTWGVDFVLLDENDNLIGDAVAYRDHRTAGMVEELEKTIPAKELYARAGIQFQNYNTIYQLAALQKEHPEHIAAKRLLMVPEYINFLLTGVKQHEYTIASTTSLLNAASQDWDEVILEKMGLPRGIFGDIAMPGTSLGSLRPEIRDEVGFDTEVVLPATHDTGSAFLAIPAKDDNAVYISSGTWSLLGVENEAPITTPVSFAENFTNEGGAYSRYRYPKNIIGLWMIQSIRRELNGVVYVQGKEQRTEAAKKWSFDDLVNEAKKAAYFPARIDVNARASSRPTACPRRSDRNAATPTSRCRRPWVN